jgi:hypothetical protein
LWKNKSHMKLWLKFQKYGENALKSGIKNDKIVIKRYRNPKIMK